MNQRSPREPDPAPDASPLLGTAVIVLALSLAAYQSPHRWSAAGLTCMTGSALVAAPELLERLLRAGNHPRIRRGAAALAKGARRLSWVIYSIFGLFVLCVALFDVSHLSTAAKTALALAAFVAAIEFVARQTSTVARELVTGGDVDKTVDARFAGWRWSRSSVDPHDDLPSPMRRVKLTGAELDEFAFHVHFEVSTLCAQLAELVERFGPYGPSGSSNDTEGQAMLEASLLHFRLLDDFLGHHKKHKEDVHASDWVPEWAARPWLAKDIRKRIDWQVAHLSSRRVEYEGWDLPNYLRACCEELVRFFGAIGEPDRLEAFMDAPEIADRVVQSSRDAPAT